MRESKTRRRSRVYVARVGTQDSLQHRGFVVEGERQQRVCHRRICALSARGQLCSDIRSSADTLRVVRHMLRSGFVAPFSASFPAWHARCNVYSEGP